MKLEAEFNVKNVENIGMQRIFRGWGCNTCSTLLVETAHIQAVSDWFMLISDTMTNRDCREFLHISSGQTTTRLDETIESSA